MVDWVETCKLPVHALGNAGGCPGMASATSHATPRCALMMVAIAWQQRPLHLFLPAVAARIAGSETASASSSAITGTAALMVAIAQQSTRPIHRWCQLHPRRLKKAAAVAAALGWGTESAIMIATSRSAVSTTAIASFPRALLLLLRSAQRHRPRSHWLHLRCDRATSMTNRDLQQELQHRLPTLQALLPDRLKKWEPQLHCASRSCK
mmetsp:Transcript_69099/g.122487  ORF Transcript_69099/g.122487 Transcript_69099/m.122487 type:complete len:208 (+) Transcript_69099:70-693(+)